MNAPLKTILLATDGSGDAALAGGSVAGHHLREVGLVEEIVTLAEKLGDEDARMVLPKRDCFAEAVQPRVTAVRASPSGT